MRVWSRTNEIIILFIKDIIEEKKKSTLSLDARIKLLENSLIELLLFFGLATIAIYVAKDINIGQYLRNFMDNNEICTLKTVLRLVFLIGDKIHGVELLGTIIFKYIVFGLTMLFSNVLLKYIENRKDKSNNYSDKPKENPFNYQVKSYKNNSNLENTGIIDGSTKFYIDNNKDFKIGLRYQLSKKSLCNLINIQSLKLPMPQLRFKKDLFDDNIPLSLKKVIIDNSEIDNKELISFSFDGCDSIEEVEIVGGIETIRSNAFSNCPNLKRITILCKVNNIEDNAFYNCPQLDELYCNKKFIPYMSLSAFNRCGKLRTTNIKDFTNINNIIYK